MLDGNDGCVLTESEVRGPRALRQCARYIHQRQLCFGHGS
jgi:hypothetical protein